MYVNERTFSAREEVETKYVKVSWSLGGGRSKGIHLE